MSAWSRMGAAGEWLRATFFTPQPKEGPESKPERWRVITLKAIRACMDLGVLAILVLLLIRPLQMTVGNTLELSQIQSDRLPYWIRIYLLSVFIAWLAGSWVPAGLLRFLIRIAAMAITAIPFCLTLDGFGDLELSWLIYVMRLPIALFVMLSLRFFLLSEDFDGKGPTAEGTAQN